MKLIDKKQDVIIDFLEKNKGVLTTSELKTLLACKNKVQFYRELKKLISQDIIIPFSRGIYVSKSPNLEVISQRIQPKSYLSLGNALSWHMMIGSTPAKAAYAIKIGKNRTYKGECGEIIHLSISVDLFFGFEVQDGIWRANKEKAFLDTLYYYLKGQKYSFDIFSDLDLTKLNKKKVEDYLRKYKNKKFITFVRRFLNDQH